MHDLFTFLLPYATSPITWFLFVLGACVGSFLNVCIIRIPAGTFWSSLRSHCPHCQQSIPLWHNIPILSWLILRGRSACCGQPIAKQYPLVEFLTALLFVVIYWRLPFVRSYDGVLHLDSENVIRFLHAAVFCSALLTSSVIDFHLKIIPDKINLPMIALTPLVIYLHPDLDWFSGLVGVLVGGLSLYIVAWLYVWMRGEAGLGFGDVKLLAAIGGWLGYQAIIPTIMVGSIVGAMVGIGWMIATRQWNLKLALPFGPFLSLGAVNYLLFGQEFYELFL